MILPSLYSISGNWQSYRIRWIVQDIESGEFVWSYEYKGRHILLQPDENAEKRARKFIDHALTTLAAAGLL